MALAGVVPLCWDSVSHRETSTHGSEGEIPYNSPQVSALYSSPFVWEHLWVARTTSVVTVSSLKTKVFSASVLTWSLLNFILALS